MNKKIFLLLLILSSTKVWSQDIYVVNNINEIKVVDQSFNVTNLFQIDIFQAGYLLDLAFTPSGVLYGVSNSWKLIKIDLDSASFEIVDTLPFNATYTGMTCNAQGELILCKWLQQELYKYNLDNDTLMFVDDSISSPGDFTYYKGNLIYPGFLNDFIKSYDGSTIKNVGCAVPLLYSFVNVFDSCEANTVYGIDEDSKVYQYDIENGFYTQVADLLAQAGPINGAATMSEFRASECDLDVLTEYTCPFSNVEELQSNPYLVYPNPSYGSIIIEGLTEKVLHITFFDVNGRAIRFDAPDVNQALDISNFSSGIYSMRIVTEQSIHYEQIIKM